jgi:glycine dehydrogenase subunit 1
MYAKGQNISVVTIPAKDGVSDLSKLEELVDEETAAVIVQYPNFFGQIEDLAKVEQLTHEQKALFIVSANPLALGALTPPGKFGADITVGDAQPFGISEAFGGPHCGFFAVSSKLMRKVPGRLIGETIDEEGRRGFVLTLQAREQHIRRDKATSNICSNQALNALAASVAMTALGKKGVKEMAIQNITKTHYAKQAFEQAGFVVPFQGSHFNEIVVKVNGSVADANKALLEKGIIGGFDLGRVNSDLKNHVLIAVTEQRTKEEIDALVQEMGALYA